MLKFCAQLLFAVFVFLVCENTCAAADAQKITIYGKRQRRLNQTNQNEVAGESLSVGGSSLGATLSQSPSIYVPETSSEASVPNFLIRGQDTIENRYFLEGFPLSNARFHQPDLEVVSSSFLSDIEIYAGGIPVVFGEDGLGGAVNFGVNPVGGSGETSAKVGSFGYLSTYADVNSGEHVRIGLEYAQSNEDFQFFDDNGTPFNTDDDSFRRRDNNQMRRYTLVPRVTLSTSKTHQLEALSWHTLLTRQIPGPTFAPSSGDLREYFQLTGLRSRVELSANASLETHGYFRAKQETLNDIPPYVGSTVQSFESSTTAVGVRSQLRWWPARLDFVTGANWERYQIEVLSTSDKAQQSRWQIPVGLSSRWHFFGKKVEVQPVLQMHYFDYYSSGNTVFGSVGSGSESRKNYILASPRVGLRVLPTSAWRLRASAGSYYRAPALFELYGSPVGVSPSPDLNYETALKGELGTDIEIKNLGRPLRSAKFSYTFAISRARDLITYVQNSQQSSVAINIGESRILSHEFLLALESNFGVGLTSSLTLMDSKNYSDISYQNGKDLPFRPATRVQETLAYRYKGLELSYQLSWVGETFADTSNTRKLAGVLYHNAGVGWDSKTFGVFRLEARNLGDATTGASSYYNSEAETIDFTTGYPGYPAPGRRVYLTWLTEI